MLDFYTNCEGIWITPNKILCGSELLSREETKRYTETDRETHIHHRGGRGQGKNE